MKNDIENLPVEALSAQEQIDTNGGGERTGEKQGGWWDKIRDMLLT